MIPIRDSTRSRTFPLVNVTLIVLNVLIYFYQAGLPNEQLWEMYRRYAVIPIRYSGLGLEILAYPELVFPFFTAAFMHGGLMHLGGNMLYLWIFGDNVEDRFGHVGYLLFYLAVAVLSNVAHIWANPISTLPTLGASGALAGVLGAYFLMFPRARVLALVPLGFFLHITEVPALVFLFIWFMLQLFSGLMTLGVPSAQGGGVAWWAHIGGFAFGLLLTLLFARRRRWPPG